MYCRFYGFSERPFEATPDPKFLYLSPTHREVLASLTYGIRERRGFVAVLGEAGTGKTTLLRSVLDGLEADVKAAYVFNTDFPFQQLLHMILMDLGLADEKERLRKAEAIHRLNELAIRQLSRGGNLVIIVDEAQDLNRRCLENLRLLSNLETSKKKLIQIILSGQPELEEKLKQPDLRQLSQRINLRRYILPFDEKETHEYISHRLKVVGYDGHALFTKEAELLIWLYSGGIPRKINTVCDNALLIGYALKERKIGDDTVREAIDDLYENPFSDLSTARADWEAARARFTRTSSGRRRFGSVRLFVLASCLSLLTGFGLATLGLHMKGELLLSPQSNVRTMRPEEQTRASGPVPVSEHPAALEAKAAPPPAVAAAPAEKVLPAAPASPTPAKKKSELPPAQIPQVPVGAHPASVQKSPPVKKSTVVEVHPAPPQKAAGKEKSAVVEVRAGDTFFRIVMTKYGRYDKVIESKVLAANPEIKDPSQINAQQRITLPALPSDVGPDQ
jgi:general secretion pathway protein A